jgi:hypothetical protein
MLMAAQGSSLGGWAKEKEQIPRKTKIKWKTFITTHFYWKEISWMWQGTLFWENF